MPATLRSPALRATLVAAACIALLAPTARAQTLNLKLGGWDMVYKTEGTMKDLPASVKAMPPEKRAKMEQALRNAMRPRTTPAKVCLKKEDLDRFTRTPDDTQCKTSNVKRTATLFEADMSCKDGRTGHIRLEAPAPDRVSGRVDQVQPAAEGGGKLAMEITGKWAGASCAGFSD